jgi:hypothetical protein
MQHRLCYIMLVTGRHAIGLYQKLLWLLLIVMTVPELSIDIGAMSGLLWVSNVNPCHLGCQQSEGAI